MCDIMFMNNLNHILWTSKIGSKWGKICLSFEDQKLNVCLDWRNYGGSPWFW